MLDELLKPHDVARELTVSTRTIWRWLRCGILPRPIRLGRLIRWRRRDIQDYIRRMAEGPK